MGRIKIKKKEKKFKTPCPVRQLKRTCTSFGEKNEIKFVFLFNSTIIVVIIVNNNYKLFTK